jgi:hypothetical protein
MWKRFRRYGFLLFAVVTWLFLARDILLLPQDLQALPSAPRHWGDLMSWVGQWISRETALLIFSGLLILWIIWIQGRPAYTRWRASRTKHPIQVEWGGFPFYTDRYDKDLLMVFGIRIRNTDLTKVLEGIEVHLERFQKQNRL